MSWTSCLVWGFAATAVLTTVMAGSAAVGASRKVKDKLLRIASGTLEIDPEDLMLVDGKVQAQGVPERSLSFAEIVQLAAPGPALQKGFEPGISEEDFFASDQRPFPYGVHIAVAEVDQETGLVKILDYLIAEDVGNAWRLLVCSRLSSQWTGSQRY